MLKKTRAFFGLAVLLVFLAALPVSSVIVFKSNANSLLKVPFSFSAWSISFFNDLFHFRKNASEVRQLKNTLAQFYLKKYEIEELSRENVRLSKLLNLKQSLVFSPKRIMFSRVIGRSPASWSHAVLIDKGTRQGVRINLLVLSESSLVGKVIEAGPAVSKVLLITDPNFKMSVLIQRTRQAGVLYGTPGGECRMKYISVEAEVRTGDVVETAGMGGFFPKGLLIGTIEKCWKEPGQMYQVASVKPVTDLSRIEEVALIE